MPGAGAVESQTPVWQTGGGDRCYVVSASDAGTLSIRVTVDAGTVWAALLANGAPCVLPGGTTPLGMAPQVGRTSRWRRRVRTRWWFAPNSATTGTVALSVPAASYDARSTWGNRTTIARLVAGYSGVKVESWQLN